MTISFVVSECNEQHTRYFCPMDPDSIKIYFWNLNFYSILNVLSLYQAILYLFLGHYILANFFLSMKEHTSYWARLDGILIGKALTTTPRWCLKNISEIWECLEYVHVCVSLCSNIHNVLIWINFDINILECNYESISPNCTSYFCP